MVSSLKGGQKETTPTLGFQISALPQWEQLLHQPHEQWVMDYERFQAQLARQERKQGKTQDGVFYTPPNIAAYLAHRTLGRILERQFQAIEQAMQDNQPDKAQEILWHVQKLKIIDPACGTGVFLVEVLRLLADFYRRIQQRFSTISCPNNADTVLRNQLYGVDLDPVSVAITEFRLAQTVCRLDQKNWRDFENYQSQHYVCADTLTNQPFPSLEWDFVLGNPPYVSEVRKQSGRLKPLQQDGSFYQAKMDLCDAFTAWGVERLKTGGQLAYVLPEYWMQRTSSGPLRELLWRKGTCEEIWTFGQTTVFKDAPGHHTALLIWIKQGERGGQSPVLRQSMHWGQPDDFRALSESMLRPALLLKDSRSGKFLLGNEVEINLLNRLAALPPLLSSQQIQQGVVLPQGRLKKSDWQKLPERLKEAYSPDAGIFLLSESEIEALSVNEAEQALLRPYYGPAVFEAFAGFNHQPPQYQLIYTDQTVRRLFLSDAGQYPVLKAHLDRFASILTSAFKPYGLHRPRQPKWFEEGRKIFCARQVIRPAFAVVSHPAYVTEGFYSILPEENADFLCAILNSRLAWFWFYHQKRKGHRLQIDKEVLLAFPQPNHRDERVTEQLITISQALAGSELTETERKALTEELNRLVNQLYELTPAETDWLQSAEQAIFCAQ